MAVAYWSSVISRRAVLFERGRSFLAVSRKFLDKMGERKSSSNNTRPTSVVSCLRVLRESTYSKNLKKMRALSAQCSGLNRFDTLKLIIFILIENQIIFYSVLWIWDILISKEKHITNEESFYFLIIIVTLWYALSWFHFFFFYYTCKTETCIRMNSKNDSKNGNLHKYLQSDDYICNIIIIFL